eukprot:5881816-Amphidinium_carterae.1
MYAQCRSLGDAQKWDKAPSQSTRVRPATHPMSQKNPSSARQSLDSCHSFAFIFFKGPCHWYAIDVEPTNPDSELL